MNQKPDDPYRAMTPRPPSELERLAAEGRARHDAITRGTSGEMAAEASYNLRVAIGGFQGTPFKRGVAMVHYVLLATFVGTLALIVADVVDGPSVAPVLMIAGFVSFLLIFVRAFTAPKASHAQVEAEARWMQSLPFGMLGYFETLQATPETYVTLRITVTWAQDVVPPDPATLLGVARVADPMADQLQLGPGTATWMSQRISGSTNIRVNNRYIYRNHRIPPYVHDLVMRTLVPLHRNCAIASVQIGRW